MSLLVMLCATIPTVVCGDESVDKYSLCYKDTCMGTKMSLPVQNGEQTLTFACPEPESSCDISGEAFKFCGESMHREGKEKAYCARQLWEAFCVRGHLFALIGYFLMIFLAFLKVLL